MKVGVKILLKKEVLDSQGRAVEGVLKNQGSDVSSVRVGRYVVLDLPAQEKDVALRKAQEMAKSVLHNPLIETFELEVL